VDHKLRPLLRTVQDTKNFHDALSEDKVRQAGEYEFAGIRTATRASLSGKFL
jgi:hypothetical protein